MAQFEVYENRGKNSDIFPYLVDITNNLHSNSKLRVVVPLCSDSYAISKLNPYFSINGKKLYLSTMDIAGVPATILGDSVTTLKEYRSQIIDAIDFLINGF